MSRNYRDEYDAYHGTKEQKRRRAQRNKARREAETDGRVKKGDGKEVHHVNAPRTGNLPNKTRVISKRANRIMQPKRGK
jgi:hypothetical protein